MKEYNAVANVDSFYRIHELDRNLEKIKDTVLGRSESFLPFVTGEDGKLDKDKVDAFVNELLEGFTNYHASYVTMKNASDEETLSFYRDVLYLAIVAPLVSPGYAFDVEYSVAETFRSLIDVALDSAFSEKTWLDLIGREEFDRLNDYWDMDFIYALNDAYYTLTGKIIRATYNKEEKAVADDVYLDVVGQYYDDPEEEKEPIQATSVTVVEDQNDDDDLSNKDTESEEPGNKDGESEDANPFVINARVITPDDPEYDAIMKEDEYDKLVDDSEEPLYEPDYDDYLAQIEMEEQYLSVQRELCEDTRKAWKEHLGNCDRLVETYMRFREKMFLVKRENLADDITEMIDIFLYRHELSAISLGKPYGLIAHRVEETSRLISDEIKRARLLS